MNLSIKNVPEAVAERLRARAERHRRSLQGELLAIIEAAADDETATLHAAAPAPALSGAARIQGWKSVRDLVAERRARRAGGEGSPAAAQGLPLAVDIVRAERDRRAGA